MKTAAEQLEKQILDNWMAILTGKVYIGDLFEQAKEMEKEQRGYSEEEVLVLLHKRDNHNIDNPNTFNGWLTPKEWFEQFKQQEQ
jgi:hypothetical protein